VLTRSGARVLVDEKRLVDEYVNKPEEQFETEEQIFEALNCPYRKPSMRFC